MQAVRAAAIAFVLLLPCTVAAQTPPSDSVSQALKTLLPPPAPPKAAPAVVAPTKPTPAPKPVAPVKPPPPPPPPAPVAQGPDPSDALNQQVYERDRQIAARNAANLAAAREATTRYEAALNQRQAEIARAAVAEQAAQAKHQAEVAAYNAQVAKDKAAADAVQKRYEADRAAWEARVKACNAGRVSACGT